MSELRKLTAKEQQAQTFAELNPTEKKKVDITFQPTVYGVTIDDGNGPVQYILPIIIFKLIADAVASNQYLIKEMNTLQQELSTMHQQGMTPVEIFPKIPDNLKN